MDTGSLSLAHILADILPTAGVGGILALVMFHFYRVATAEHIKRIEEMSARWERASEGWVRIVQDNTAAITRLANRLDPRG